MDQLTKRQDPVIIKYSVIRRGVHGKKTGCSAVGSAPALGAGCRRFKSCHSDHRRRGLCIVRGDFFIKVVDALTPLLLLSAKSHVTLVNALTMLRLATKYNGDIIEYIRDDICNLS